MSQRRSYKAFLRDSLTENVGKDNRFILAFGFFIMAFDMTPVWWQLLGAAIWTLVAQGSLYSAYMNGWMDRHQESEGLNVEMGAFLDLCERHGVSPQEVAALIWREKDT